MLSAFLVAESISEVRPARRETECCSLVSGRVAQLVEHPSKVQVWCSSTEVGWKHAAATKELGINLAVPWWMHGYKNVWFRNVAKKYCELKWPEVKLPSKAFGSCQNQTQEFSDLSRFGLRWRVHPQHILVIIQPSLQKLILHTYFSTTWFFQIYIVFL